MYCRYCKKQIPNDSQYCGFCGMKIIDSLDEESDVNVNQKENERCRICKKKFNNNERRIPLETGGMMCEDCAAAFWEEKIESEDTGFVDEDEFDDEGDLEFILMESLKEVMDEDSDLSTTRKDKNTKDELV